MGNDQGWMKNVPQSPIARQKLQSLTRSQKQIKKAYNIHSSFLAKHHIDGIVAMLEVSDVDNVCVCLKRSGQFALKRAFIDSSPHHMPSPLQGHFGLAEGLAI